ncbi:MAG: methyltransferase domain-containing protein, partial [Planctomycetia bacterium]
MTHPNAQIRRELARQLHGDGVEFGPGCHPQPLGPHVTRVRYCDAHDRAAFLELFPEVADEIDGFPATIDFRLDCAKEPFVDAVGRSSLDFIVANHLLEHLVDPLRFLEQAHDVLRDDGLLYIGQPDKRAMFDRDRRRTSLEDVVDRHRRRETELSDARIVEYVNTVDAPATPFHEHSPDFATEAARHRRRSLHVNVWLVDDLLAVFRHLADELDRPFELIDGATTPS